MARQATGRMASGSPNSSLVFRVRSSRGCTPQPAGAQAQAVRGQQQILDGRRAVLEQVAELAVVRGFNVTADDNGQRRALEHVAVGQKLGQRLHRGPAADDDEAPGIARDGRRRRHGGLQELKHLGVADFAGHERADAAAAQNEAEAFG